MPTLSTPKYKFWHLIMHCFYCGYESAKFKGNLTVRLASDLNSGSMLSMSPSPRISAGILVRTELVETKMRDYRTILPHF